MSKPHIYTSQDFENSVYYWKELSSLQETESKRLEQELAHTKEQLKKSESESVVFKNGFETLMETFLKTHNQLTIAREALEFSQKTICDEFCGLGHHPFCKRTTEALEKLNTPNVGESSVADMAGREK